MKQPAPEQDRTDEFVKLLSQNQRRLVTYVLTMVPNWADAEEILQETNVVLWREFERFELGTNFFAWSAKIAFHQVLAYRKRMKRDRLQFSDAFLEAVASDSADSTDALDARYQAMSHCIEKLQPAHREILRRRYTDGADIDEVAERAGRTVGALYRLLSRIRRTLHECITQTLAAEARI